MPQLKSLRGAMGSYGRVTARGIVDVTEPEAEKMIKTGRFVKATPDDIEAAKATLQASLTIGATGATTGFSAMPEKLQPADRLQKMIEAGEISPAEAKMMARLQISVSTEEVQALIKREADEIAAQIATAQADLDERQAELDQREADLIAREDAIAAAEEVQPTPPAVDAAATDTEAGKSVPEAGAKQTSEGKDRPEAAAKKAAK